MEHYWKNDFELRQQSYTPNFVSFYGINFASPLDEDDVGEILCYFPFSGFNFGNFWVWKVSYLVLFCQIQYVHIFDQDLI